LDLISGNKGEGNFADLKEMLALRTTTSNELVMNSKMNILVHLGTRKVRVPQKLRRKIINTTVCLMRISNRRYTICVPQPTEKVKRKTNIISVLQPAQDFVLNEKRKITLHGRSSVSKRN
jgi:hypothetical protein